MLKVAENDCKRCHYQGITRAVWLMRYALAHPEKFSDNNICAQGAKNDTRCALLEITMLTNTELLRLHIIANDRAKEIVAPYYIEQ